MSRRNKLQKFSELLSFPNVYENFDPKNPGLIGQDGVDVQLKGEWVASHFKNDAPLTLELACGRGEYCLGMSRMYPERNFVGVDIKGARIWKGASIALEEGLSNVAFLRTRIEQIDLFFSPAEVSEIWITFPDPFLSKTKTNRRLTSPRFIDRFRKILKPGGLCHLKTDDPTLYEYSLETLSEIPFVTITYQNDNIYEKELLLKELELKTYYENLHLKDKRTIKYLQFTID